MRLGLPPSGKIEIENIDFNASPALQELIFEAVLINGFFQETVHSGKFASQFGFRADVGGDRNNFGLV